MLRTRRRTLPIPHSRLANPHSPLAVASCVVGGLAAAGSATPHVRGLGGRWLQLIASSLVRQSEQAPAEASLSALYVLPFLLMLGCAALAIGLGVIAHAKAGLCAQTGDAQQQSQLASVGIFAGGVSLWLLLHLG